MRPTMRSRPMKVAEPSLRYIMRYSTCPSPSISPVKDLATLARVSLGRSCPSLYGFSSQLLMANRAFAVFMYAHRGECPEAAGLRIGKQYGLRVLNRVARHLHRDGMAAPGERERRGRDVEPREVALHGGSRTLSVSLRPEDQVAAAQRLGPALRRAHSLQRTPPHAQRPGAPRQHDEARHRRQITFQGKGPPAAARS